MNEIFPNDLNDLVEESNQFQIPEAFENYVHEPASSGFSTSYERPHQFSIEEEKSIVQGVEVSIFKNGKVCLQVQNLLKLIKLIKRIFLTCSQISKSIARQNII